MAAAGLNAGLARLIASRENMAIRNTDSSLDKESS